jgi:TRAP-type C4-dicarboxylate transport system permease small subunit
MAMKWFEAVAAWVFGLAFIGLAGMVTVETLMRKLANHSFQGVDELSGYVLAVGGALSFAVAVAGRTHIRIDIVHDRLPRALRIVLNILAAATLAAGAAALLGMAWFALSDSILFRATAQTPWATPLRIPQTVWVVALGVFLAVALLQIGRIVWLAIGGRFETIDRSYSPRGSRDELEEELADIKARGADKVALGVEPTR